MLELNCRYFRVYWNPYRPVELKKNGKGYQLTKNVDHYGCLIKKNCQLKLFAMARTFVGLADVSLHYDLFSL